MMQPKAGGSAQTRSRNLYLELRGWSSMRPLLPCFIPSRDRFRHQPIQLTDTVPNIFQNNIAAHSAIMQT